MSGAVAATYGYIPVRSPRAFSFKPEEWSAWKHHFNRYRTLSKLDKEEGKIQVASLTYHMGRRAHTLCKTFTFDDPDDKNNYEKVLQKFDDHFLPKINVIRARFNFNQRVQKMGETIDEYVRALYDLADLCQYGEYTDELIRDKLFSGLMDNMGKDMLLDLLLEEDLTLDKTVDLARRLEMEKEQDSVHQYFGNMSLEEDVRQNSGSSKQKSGRKQASASHSGMEENSRQSCSRCGRQHGGGATCLAIGKRCYKCNKAGHFAAVCRSKVMGRSSQLREIK